MVKSKQAYYEFLNETLCQKNSISPNFRFISSFKILSQMRQES